MAQNWTVKVSHIESEALSTLKLYWLFYQMMHFYALLILPLSKMFADFSSRRFSPKFNCHPHTGWLNASPDKITIVFLNEIPSHQPSIYVYIYTIIDYNDTIMYKKYIQYIYIYTCTHIFPLIGWLLYHILNRHNFATTWYMGCKWVQGEDPPAPRQPDGQLCCPVSPCTASQSSTAPWHACRDRDTCSREDQRA